MATSTKREEDHWDSIAYQTSASFVPKLATKVLGWLDVQKDDVILDVGCGGEFLFIFPCYGEVSPRIIVKRSEWKEKEKCFLTCLSDGVLNIQIAKTLATGTGRIHGVDSSAAMIETAKREAEKEGVAGICTFEVLDATAVINSASLARGTYDKVFSNAAMHVCILRPTPLYRPRLNWRPTANTCESGS